MSSRWSTDSCGRRGSYAGAASCAQDAMLATHRRAPCQRKGQRSRPLLRAAVRIPDGPSVRDPVERLRTGPPAIRRGPRVSRLRYNYGVITPENTG
jgi:hypothetical protein